MTSVAAAVLGPNAQLERVEQGVSTTVYRVRLDNETFYLRILPEPGASFVPEAEVHAQALRLGARVPEVIFVDPCDAVLGLSVMIAREVPGRPIAEASALSPDVLEEIVRAAGRDLARINSIPVAGFGWVERAKPGTVLAAEHASWRDVIMRDWAADLAFLADTVLTPAEVAALERLITSYDAWLDAPHAWLAHGDLDATHIFEHSGRYSGMIDFGEIRGAGRWYDLGHFHMRDGERLSQPLLPALLSGYGEILALPDDIEQRVRWEAVLINVRALARSLRKRPHDYWTRHQLAVLRADIAALG